MASMTSKDFFEFAASNFPALMAKQLCYAMVYEFSELGVFLPTTLRKRIAKD
jgi:hypothetical protein